MAAIEVETEVRLVLTKEQVDSMKAVLDSHPAEAWVRLVINTDYPGSNDGLRIYVQGPSDEEEEIIVS